jgi:hypothetical protein
MVRYSRIKALISLELDNKERRAKEKAKAKEKADKQEAIPKLPDNDRWDNLKSAQPED